MGKTHLIKNGENLDIISKRYGVTVQAIAELNDIDNPNLIYAGNTLIIPETKGNDEKASPPASDLYNTDYASKFKTEIASPPPSVSDKTTQNNSGSNNTSGKTTSSSGDIYIVKDGEYLDKIAATYGTTSAEIAKLNNLSNPNLIYSGQELKIPGVKGYEESPPDGITLHPFFDEPVYASLPKPKGESLANKPYVNEQTGETFNMSVKNEHEPSPFDAKYQGFSHDELVKASNDLWAEYIVTGDDNLRAEYNYVNKRSSETSSSDVLDWKADRAGEKADSENNEKRGQLEGTVFFQYLDIYPEAFSVSRQTDNGFFIYDIDENYLKSVGLSEAAIFKIKNAKEEWDKIADSKNPWMGEEIYYSTLATPALKKEITAKFETTARQGAGFDVHSKYDEGISDGVYKIVNSDAPVNSWGEGSIMPIMEERYFLEPHERGVYNYWYKINPEKAEEYLKEMRPILYERLTKYNQENFSKLQKENPVFANMQATMINLGAAIPGALYTIGASALDNYDANHPMLQPHIATETVRGETSDAIDNHFWNFVYNTGMSMVDSALVMPLGSAGAALLGANAATAAGRQTALEGGDGWQIFVNGLAAGTFEYAFEKIGFDNLFGPKAVSTLADGIKNILKQVGVEAGEEFCTSVANMVVNNVTMGDKGQFNTSVQKYMDAGYTYEEAFGKTIVDTAGDVALDTLAGAFSGGIFGSVDAGIRYSGNVNASGTDVKTAGGGKHIGYADVAEYVRRNGATSESEIYRYVIENSYDKNLPGKLSEMSEAERAFMRAGAKGLSSTDASRLAEGMEIDQTSAWNAWKMGAKEYQNGNGESLELLIDATNYLDRNPDSAIMEEEKSDIYENLNAETYSDYKKRVPDASETDYKLYIKIKNIGEFGIIRVPPLQIDISGLEVLNDHAFNHGCTIDDAKKYIASAKCSITRNKWDGKHINYYSLDGATYLNEDGKVNTIFSKEDFDTKTDKIVEVFR